VGRMKTFTAGLVLFLGLLLMPVRAASPDFRDFDPSQFLYQPTPPPGQYKVSLLLSFTNAPFNILIVNNFYSSNAYITNIYSSNAFITNITANTIVTSNFFVTNITVESTFITTNNNFYSFITNLYASYAYITNLTVQNITVQSNANIVGYIADFNGIGTNTTLFSPILYAPVYILTTNGIPIEWLFLDGDNTTILGGWSTNRGGFFGGGLGLSNILFSALVSPTNGVSSATAIDFSVPEATTNIAGNVAFTSILNWNPTNYNYAIRHIINATGANKTLTVGAGWGTDPNSRTTVTTYTLTNGCVIDLLVGSQINVLTNANVLFGCP